MRDLAGIDEALHRRHGVGQWNGGVGPMQIIEIDAVDPEPGQRPFRLATYVGGRQALVFCSRPDLHPDFGGDHRIRPAPLQRRADEGLGNAAGRTDDAAIAFITVGRVDEIDPGVECRVAEADRVLAPHGRAERHRPEAKLRHLEIGPGDGTPAHQCRRRAAWRCGTVDAT